MEREQREKEIQLERQLLVGRLTVFVVTSSVLFLGFAALDICGLRIVVCSAGILTCFVAFFHFFPIYRRLNQYLSESGKKPEKRWGIWRLFSGRILGWLWFPLIFLIIWSLGLVGTVQNWG